MARGSALDVEGDPIWVGAGGAGGMATTMYDLDDSDIEAGSGPSIPIAGPGSKHEIASRVAWLGSEGASYTTGQSLIVD
ncbi:SDR family oxidoreductase, partial [Salmonella enterica]|uniref:SDR family oxidoreductase n=1 Tax=Salmonella enterica TaxID=28901 RepID=UPI00398C3364